ncbi:MAG: hypothetical protein QXM38_00045 [Candidatus Aenigmatarchaeota archaeon]
MTKKTIKTKQVLSIIFILILMGSVLAYGIIALFGNNKTSYLPKERILNHKLDPAQVALLVNYYYTVIEYNYTTDCMECLQIKNYLEELTQNSDGQIYLQEIIVDQNSSLYIVNILNETLIENPSLSEAINAVCDSLITTPVWCAINRI